MRFNTRCEDLPPALKYKGSNVFVLGIVPGPKEPKSMDAYLRRTAEAFKRLGPGEGHLELDR